jgi:hypothetical protein
LILWSACAFYNSQRVEVEHRLAQPPIFPNGGRNIGFFLVTQPDNQCWAAYFHLERPRRNLRPRAKTNFMKPTDKKMNKIAAVFTVFSVCLSLHNPAWAESDKEIQEKALKARELNQGGVTIDHSAHIATDATSGQFRGVFYGYLPCHEDNCNGLKMTLSLNANNKYLLVSQPAKVFNRESFEKGTYQWDEAKGTVLLTPYQNAPQRKLAIKNEGVLLYLSDDAMLKTGNQDKYLLQRADKAGNREMHIH